MGKPLKPVACSLKPSRSTLAIVGISLFASTLLSGCVTAVIAIGVTAVGIGAAALAYECDEPVSVSVWDPGTAHVICDATVTATSGSDKVELSPCYTTTLGEGTWTVTAVRPGYSAATGTITVLPEHRCNEPVYHTLELTLSATGPMPPPPPPPPLPPAFMTPPGTPGPAQTGTAPPPNAAPPAATGPGPQTTPPQPAPAPPATNTSALPATTATGAPKASFPTAPPAPSAR